MEQNNLVEVVFKDNAETCSGFFLPGGYRREEISERSQGWSHACNHPFKLIDLNAVDQRVVLLSTVLSLPDRARRPGGRHYLIVNRQLLGSVRDQFAWTFSQPSLVRV